MHPQNSYTLFINTNAISTISAEWEEQIGFLAHNQYGKAQLQKAPLLSRECPTDSSPHSF